MIVVAVVVIVVAAVVAGDETDRCCCCCYRHCEKCLLFAVGAEAVEIACRRDSTLGEEQREDSKEDGNTRYSHYSKVVVEVVACRSR